MRVVDLPAGKEYNPGVAYLHAGTIAVVDTAAAGAPFSVGVEGIRQRVHQNASSRAPEYAAEVKGHATGADDGNAGPVAESDRMVAVDENCVQHRADHARVAWWSDAHAWRKTRIDRELRGVFAGDQEAALLNELFQMSESVVT